MQCLQLTKSSSSSSQHSLHLSSDGKIRVELHATVHDLDYLLQAERKPYQQKEHFKIRRIIRYANIRDGGRSLRSFVKDDDDGSRDGREVIHAV